MTTVPLWGLSLLILHCSQSRHYHVQEVNSTVASALSPSPWPLKARSGPNTVCGTQMLLLQLPGLWSSSRAPLGPTECTVHWGGEQLPSLFPICLEHWSAKANHPPIQLDTTSGGQGTYQGVGREDGWAIECIKQTGRQRQPETVELSHSSILPSCPGLPLAPSDWVGRCGQPWHFSAQRCVRRGGEGCWGMGHYPPGWIKQPRPPPSCRVPVLCTDKPLNNPTEHLSQISLCRMADETFVFMHYISLFAFIIAMLDSVNFVYIPWVFRKSCTTSNIVSCE